MHKKIVRLLSASVVTMGAFLWGCSESDLGSGASDFKGGTAVIKNDSKQMWAKINESGSIATYFDSLSQKGKAPVVNSSSHYNNQCAAPALQMDENTRYLDELESLFDEGELVEGVCGKALKLDDGQVAPLGVNLIDSMSVGTVEFWFRPNEDFYDKKARTLIGNDGARIHFFYKNGEIYFQKNHHNQHFYVKGAVELKDDWNLIAGQWGDGYMSVWVNGELVDRWEHTKGYVPAQRGIPFENLVVIGYKSSCCMEGPGQYEAMTTSGSFDQFRISNIARYSLPDSIVAAKEDQKDSTSISSSSSIMPKSSSSVDTVVVVKDSLITDTLTGDSSIVLVGDSVVVDSTAKKDSVQQEPLWNLLQKYGIPGFFEKNSVPTTKFIENKCNDPSFVMDEQTLYLDELEALYREGELVDGVCGKALLLKDGEVAPTGINLIDNMPAGTVEFWFRPNDDFFDKSTRTLLGNDGSRVHFFVKDRNLIFQKNHANEHFFVKAPMKFNKGWNHIAGQWGNGTMSLWLNDELLASENHSLGYEAAARNVPYENLIVIGYKSGCCMEGLDQKDAMTTSGAYDQVRISNVDRYGKKRVLDDSDDTVVVDVKPVVDTLSKDKPTAKDSVTIIKQPKIEADTSVKKDSVRVDVPAEK